MKKAILFLGLTILLSGISGCASTYAARPQGFVDVKTVSKKSFTVIGKEGQGKTADSRGWIPALWQEAGTHMNEIAPLAKKDKFGRITGYWGAMSDINMNFEKWGEEGKYLAGVEAVDGSQAPEGWTKWVIPSFKYLAVKCDFASYDIIFDHMINRYIPQHGYELAGAVHEFYDPQLMEGELYLYFPVKKSK